MIGDIIRYCVGEPAGGVDLAGQSLGDGVESAFAGCAYIERGLYALVFVEPTELGAFETLRMTMHFLKFEVT